ncbi:fibronectin type III domain-containing protein [Winogradskyella eckloniae]|uniref:fibronectin type III domain-containing protein n=1 Tax=Winogradskyella eckloniae TaxID=1089306 RepID=UPI0015672264|nr:fibronectin type III domain-containing protein [Winogradskyella eckloniae]NRD20013.1 fibronectin type III domain-containing protein [Winogradskyella eckloniae]
MKHKLFLICFTVLFSISLSFANNDKYRIMIMDDPSTTITIGWNQTSGTSPIVYYDTVDHGTDHTLYSSSKTVDRTVSFKGMDNRFVRLTGLTPNTNYYFVINDSDSTSQRFWFRTAPNDLSRLSFIAGGDSRNNRTPRQDANTLVSKLKPHAVFFGGDMTDSNSSGQWQDWFDDWQLTIASDGRMFPIIPARGNHESDSETIYKLFDTPNADSYYSITFGNDLIKAYTLNSEISVLGNQKTWLENDLNTASTNLKWKMAQYHKPMRPHTDNKAENNYLYDAWAQLFYDEGVRLVVDCDSHLSKTTWPVKPSADIGNDEGFVVEQTSGTVYTGEGCWGAPLRDADDDKTWTRNSGKFNQFKLIFVDEFKIELRTIQVDNPGSVGSVSNTDPFTLPANLTVFNPPTGDVVTISNSPDISCPPRGVVCDDNDPTTIYDEEDGNCNCIGVDQLTTTNETYPIVASGDDAEEFISTGAVNITSTDLEFVDDGGSDQIVGLRFNNINIPKGATIHRAYIQFEADEQNSEVTNLTFHGELSDDSNGFTTSTNDISSRPLTSNSETWNNVAAWENTGEKAYKQRSPYLQSIVTEIISQPGWQVGNAVTFIVSGTGKRVAESRNGDVNDHPKLIVYYNSNCPIINVSSSGLPSCDSNTDIYSQDLVVEYTVAPSSGSLVVNGQSFAIGTSPQTVTLTGLTADGIDVDIDAYFTEGTCHYLKERGFEAPSKCSLGGIPDNIPDDNTNLALLTEATVYGSASNGRGIPTDILYDPLIDDYRTVTSYNEYGVAFNENLGLPSVDDGFKWQVNWPNVKYMNYITIGGSYANQDQSDSMWIISHRKDGVWTILDQGQGGWIDDGIYEWGGPNFDPIEADALRVQVYSDGSNSLVSIHLRARGGTANSNNDSTTTPKATLIQYLSPGNSCGINVPANSILYCNSAWINTDGPDHNSDTTNTIIADGTYAIAADEEVVINDLEILSGATVTVEEGASLTVKGDLINNGTLILESISTKYSSLIVEGTSTGDIQYKRHINFAAGAGSSTNANDLISAPVTGQNFGDFRAANSNILSGNIGGNLAFLFGPFSTSSDAYINYSPSDDSSTLDPGKGYRTGSTDGGTYTFDGTVQTTNVNIPINAGGASDWNLIGNPYPSYIDFDTFFNLIKTQLDTGSYQAIYGYDGSAHNGWTVLNNLTTGQLIAPGQGFFVKSKSGGGTITFTPDMRTTGTTDDFIAGRGINAHFGFIKLNSSSADSSFNTDFYFNSNATSSLDPGYDAALYSSTPPDFSIYSYLVENNNGTPFGIQALSELAMNDVTISLGVNATQGQEVTISILETDLPDAINVYLEDTLNNTYTLLTSEDYVFTANSNISGPGRFYLRFESNALNINETLLNSVQIIANPKTKSIEINGQLDTDTSYALYDLHGRAVLKNSLDDRISNQTIDVSQLTTGIYIIELNSANNQKRIQKLVIR